MSKVLAIAALNLRRFRRDRTNLFFVFVFPIAIIVLIGMQFGGDETPRLGVVSAGGSLAAGVVGDLRADDDLDVVEVGDRGDLGERVDSGELDAGVVFPEGLDDEVAAGQQARVPVLAANSPAGQRLASTVEQALARRVAVPTAVQAAVEHGAEPAAARAAAERLAPGVADRVTVRSRTAGDRLFPQDVGGYDVGAPSQLVLFTFVTGLTGAAALIQTRQLGVSRRMLATPTSVRAIIAGEATGRLGIGIVQALYILVGALVVFDVDWGDPVGALAVVVGIAAVSAGAAMCMGTFFSNPEQASGIGVVLALGLAALGGAMMPIELFGDTLAGVARLTPHYWAIDAFAELVRHDGTIADIGTQLGVLAAYSVALLLIASWRMRSLLARGG